MEITELSQYQEVEALAFGFLVTFVIGFILVFGHLLIKAIKAEPYDETSGPKYPADDVHRYDDWPELREFMQARGIKNNADFERYMREKNNAR